VVPVLQDGIAYVADSLSVDAWDVLSGRHLWHHEGPLEAIETQRAWDRFFRFDSYLDGWRQRAVSPWQVAQPTLSDGRLVAVVQAAEPRRELNDFEGIPINYPLPERRLVCLDSADGQRLWSQERPELGTEDFVNRYSVAGAPVVADGAVYTAGYILEGSINAYLAAFDLEDGSLLWRTYVCSGQQDLTMFNRPFMEHTPSPPMLRDGALYACTNLGVTASVDAFSGRVRWVTGYEFMARRASRSPDHDSRRDVRWVNRAPQIAGGSLIVMPLDAQQLLALDPSTGRTRWTMDVVRSDPRTLRFDALAPARRRPRGGRRHAHRDRRSGHGPVAQQRALPDDERAYGPLALAGNQVLLPAENALAVLDLRAGPTLRMLPWDDSLKARQDGRHLPLRRRVVAGPRTLLVTDGWDLHAIVDVEALLADALAHVSEGPEARLRAGELLMADGRLAEAAAQLDLALADPAAPAALRPELVEARLAGGAGRRALLRHARRLAGAAGLRRAPRPALRARRRGAGGARRAGRAGGRGGRAGAAGRARSRPAHGAGGPQRRRRAAGRAAGRAGRAGPGVARARGRATAGPDRVVARRAVGGQHGARLRGGAHHGAARRARPRALRPLGRARRRGPRARRRRAVAAGHRGALSQRPGRREAAPAPLRCLAGGGPRPGRAGRAVEAAAGRVRRRDHRAARARRRRAGRAGARGRPARRRAGAAAAAACAARPGRAPVRADRRGQLGRVVFPAVAGRFAPEFARCVLGSVDGAGKLFLLDTATGSIRWQLDLPSRLTSASLGYVQLLAAGDRLLAQVYAPGGSSPEASFDQIYAWSLQDRKLLWKVQAPGTAKETVLADGLLLRLDARSDDEGALSYHLLGYGTGTGCTALQLDVPPCSEAHLLLAGGRPVLHTIGGVTRDGVAFDVRLWTVDAAGGRLLGGEPLRGAGPTPADGPRRRARRAVPIKGERTTVEPAGLGRGRAARAVARAGAGLVHLAPVAVPRGRGRVLLEAGRRHGRRVRAAAAWCRWTRASGRCRPRRSPSRSRSWAGRTAAACRASCWSARRRRAPGRGRRPHERAPVRPAAALADRPGAARRARARRLRPGAGRRRPGHDGHAARARWRHRAGALQWCHRVCRACRRRSRWRSAKERS
jgi:outer membrane protein assembly factor BamB